MVVISGYLDACKLNLGENDSCGALCSVPKFFLGVFYVNILLPSQ